MVETIGSSAIEVTFFEDRACVKRRATVTVEQGRADVTLSGVSVLIDDTTLIARIVGDAPGRVITSRVRRRIDSVPAASREEIARLEDRHIDAWAELDLAQHAVARAQAQRHRVDHLDTTLLLTMGDVPPGPHSDAAHWREALEAIEAQIESGDDGVAEASQRLARARREEARAGLLVTEAQAEHPEVESLIELQIDSAGGELEVEIEYYVPCALWRPSHVARLHSNREAVELTMLGTVWQRTGETWDNVVCRFSTARPTHAAQAPLLQDDVLYARPKTDLERQVVQVEARDVEIASTGSVRPGIAEQMPGVDDGGEPLTMVATHPVTIPSNGEPFRVEVGKRTVACEAGVVAHPERSTVPYLRATGIWSGEVPLLAGPVVVMRGNDYAGRSRIDFVPSGERFELSFGVEAGISIHRRVDDEHTTTTLTGKNVLQRNVKVYVSNLSSQRRGLTIVERVPVSEIEEVTVKKVDSPVPPDDDGFVELAIELAPRSVETLSVAYRVEYASKVQLSW